MIERKPKDLRVATFADSLSRLTTEMGYCSLVIIKLNGVLCLKTR